MNAEVRQTSYATYGFRSKRWSSAATGPDVFSVENTEEEPISEQRLDEMALNDPERLFRLVRDGELLVPLLTFAAEALGQVPPAYYPQASQLLRRLLVHSAAVVREGAIYGIAGLAERLPTVLEFVRPLAGDREPSPGVREAAAEVLERTA